MTNEEIEKTVMGVVFDQFGKNLDINRATRFQEDLSADSLDSVEVVMEIEDKLKIKIPDEEAKKLTTVGLAIDFAIEALNPKAA